MLFNINNRALQQEKQYCGRAQAGAALCGGRRDRQRPQLPLRMASSGRHFDARKSTRRDEPRKPG
jgi:hypothetical protein